MSVSKYFPLIGGLALAGAFAVRNHFQPIVSKPKCDGKKKGHHCRKHKCDKEKGSATAATASAATATAAAGPSYSGADEDKKLSDHNYVSRVYAPKVLPTVVDCPESFTHFLPYLQLKFSDAQKKLYQQIDAHSHAGMSGSPDESVFLAWLASTLGAKRIVEVGVFMGATTLALAQALPADGVVHALDTSKEFTDFGVAAWTAAGVRHKVDLRLAPAAESMKALLNESKAGTVDLVFLDANKTGYAEYYELALQLLRVGGVVAVDNVYWHGAVADKTKTDKDTVAIRAINDKVVADKRVNVSTIPIADGLTLCTKL